MPTCDRKRCGRPPTHRLTNESPRLHVDPYHIKVCEKHAHVAAVEFRNGGVNVLEAKRLRDDSTPTELQSCPVCQCVGLPERIRHPETGEPNHDCRDFREWQRER